eukprot:29602-Lingulodinium_polyedra.AAC.1
MAGGLCGQGQLAHGPARQASARAGQAEVRAPQLEVQERFSTEALPAGSGGQHAPACEDLQEQDARRARLRGQRGFRAR